MRVKMLEDTPGSPDGVTINQYIKDETYDVSDDLGNTFCRLGLAGSARTAPAAPVVVVPPVTKQDAGPAENKAV